MSKKTAAGMWDRLKGKKVCFQGKFEWGVKERLSGLAKENQATIAKDLNSKIDCLVVQDLSGAKTIQKKAISLNAKGATIQVLDADDFLKMVEPTEDEIVDLIRRGTKSAELFDAVANRGVYRSSGKAPTRVIVGQNFAGLDLSKFEFTETAFEQCDFSGAKLDGTTFSIAHRCKFDKVKSDHVDFSDPSGSSFKDATLTNAEFDEQLADADFTGADLTEARFNQYGWLKKKGKSSGLVFRKAKLKSATFGDMHLVQPDFERADLTAATIFRATVEAGNFRAALLKGATLSGAKLPNADFSGADLSQANLVDADLTGAKFYDADLTGANLRGAKLDKADLSKAKGYDPSAQAESTAGPSLTELDKIIAKAKRIRFSFKLLEPMPGVDQKRQDAFTLHGDSSTLKYGWGVSFATSTTYGKSKVKMSEDLLGAARLLGNPKIRFETLDIQTTKSPVNANELRDILTKALCEAFVHDLPDANQLAQKTKSHRAAVLKKTAGQRKQREQYKKKQEQVKAKELKKIETTVQKAVGGKVTDIAGFLKALAVRADGAKIDKATKMLKAERFKLFNDITESYLSGVVKSQTDPDLVYACRLESDGHYACCTQNLNICGGLRGSICKHLLVLIIGLVQAGELDPSAIDGWISQTHQVKPELDKEKMGEIFIKYKGAEAGEVDWRPTETVPEDYYAL